MKIHGLSESRISAIHCPWILAVKNTGKTQVGPFNRKKGLNTLHSLSANLDSFCLPCNLNICSMIFRKTMENFRHVSFPTFPTFPPIAHPIFPSPKPRCSRWRTPRCPPRWRHSWPPAQPSAPRSSPLWGDPRAIRGHGGALWRSFPMKKTMLKKTRKYGLEIEYLRVLNGNIWDLIFFVNETYWKCDDFDWDFIGEIWWTYVIYGDIRWYTGV